MRQTQTHVTVGMRQMSTVMSHTTHVSAVMSHSRHVSAVMSHSRHVSESCVCRLRPMSTVSCVLKGGRWGGKGYKRGVHVTCVGYKRGV